MVADTFLVIGAGSIGKRHAANLGVLGVPAELIPYRQFNAATIAARSDVAGIVIATATPIRLELIEICAAQGWPFYVEKPLAWTSAQVADLYAAADPVATRSMVGFMMRYHPAVRAMAARDLSDIYRFSFEIGHDVRQWRANWSFADSYASNPAGGGVLLDLCHELDMAHCLFPDAKIIDATSLGHAAFPGVDFATRVSMIAPAGAVCMDYLSPVSIRRASFRGTKAAIDLDLLGPVLRVDDGSGPVEERFDFDRNDMFIDIMRDFLALAKGRPTSGNPLMPRFDKVRASCDLIAAAWERREFQGNVAVQMT